MEWPHQTSNSSGVFLEITEGRSLYFTPRETVIFGYLFDLADTDDDGLVGGVDGGHAFLSRARLPPETLQRLWSEAGGGSPDACLARPQWFVLLALVALAQAGRPCTVRDLLTDPSFSMAPQLGSVAMQQQALNGVRANGGVSGGAHGGHQPPHRHHQQSPHQQQEQQQNSQQTVHVQVQHSHQQQGTIRSARPFPDFFLDGGVPFAPSTRASCPRSSSNSQQTSAERGGAEGSLGDDWEDAGRGGDVAVEHDQDDGYRLEITVYSHRVVGEGYGSHTEYTVLANASVPGFARRELEVARRFSDFRWLHGCFKAIPGVLPPPLPPSKWAGSSSRDFVAERMKGLQRYMTRVAQHPVLRRQYALQVFLEGTPRGLRAAKVLLPGGINAATTTGAGWNDAFSPISTAAGSNPTSPALSASPGTTPPDETVGSVRRHFSLGGADEMYGPGGGGVVIGVGGANVRQGQRRSMSFGASSDDSSSGHGASTSGAVVTWAGGSGGGGGGGPAASSWPLSVVASVGSVGYEAYGNYVATSLTSIKGVFGAVKTKARSVVGLVAGPAPIAVEPDPVYDAEVAHVEELVGPVSGSVKTMEAAAVLKRGVGYEMSRLGHYLTQVASLEDIDGGSPVGVAMGKFGTETTAAATGGGRRLRGNGDITAGSGVGVGGISNGLRGGAGLAKAEQVLGQRMERVATAWLEAIDQEESEFLDPLREQLGYLASGKEVHRGRGKALDALQAANGSLQRNKQRLHAARAQGDGHAAVVATAKMEKAEERMLNAQTQAALISKTFKSEARRFHACRESEGITAILELARAQAAFARKANAAWKQVLEDINPTDEELRQSQQRVHHPKREARIGEGKSRSGRGLSAWLGTNSVSGSGGRGKGSGEGGDGSGLSGGAANAGHGTSSGNSPGASPAEEAVTTKNMAGSNRTVGNDFRGHGEVAGAGPSHGRRDIPPASAGSGGQEVLTGGSDRFRGVYGEDVAQRERGLGMGLDVVGGLGLQGSAADGDSTARGMWGREERMAQVVVAEEAREQQNAKAPPSAPSASTPAPTSLQSHEDWEPLKQSPPAVQLETVCQDRGGSPTSTADAAVVAERMNRDTLLPQTTSSAAVAPTPALSLEGVKARSLSSPSQTVMSSSSPTSPPLSPSPHQDEPEEVVSPVVVKSGGSGDSLAIPASVVSPSVVAGSVSSRSNGSGATGKGARMSAAQRRAAAREARNKSKAAAAAIPASVSAAGNSPSTSPGDKAVTESKPSTGRGSASGGSGSASSSAGETAPPTPSNLTWPSAGPAVAPVPAHAGSRPATALSLMDSLEALSSSSGAGGDESTTAVAAVATGKPGSGPAKTSGDDDARIGEGKSEYQSDDDADVDDHGGSGSYDASGDTVAATVVRLAGSPNPPLQRGPDGKQAGGGGSEAGASSAKENRVRRLAPNGGRTTRGKLKS